MRWTPKALAKACQGELISEGTASLSSVFIDSRRPIQNGVFIPIVAARDGHEFILDALRGGAGGVLLMRDRSERWRSKIGSETTVVEVDDTMLALTRLAQSCCEDFHGPVVSVTGSNGKTTTRSLIAAILIHRYDPVLATRGNFNNQLGVPLTVLGEPHDPKAKVLELGMSASGENRHLAAIVRPSIAVITSIGLEHLETMKDLATIAKAEAEPVEFLPSDGALVIPESEELLKTAISPKFQGKIYRFGEGEQADVRVIDVEPGSCTQVRVRFSRDNTECSFRLQSFGHYNALNAAAAICVGLHLGIPVSEMTTALESVQSVGDRGRMLQWGVHTIIADCYNANPASMSAALYSLVELARAKRQRSIAILGDMLELGPRERELHAELGREATKFGVDCVVGMGTLTQYLIGAARANEHPAAIHLGYAPQAVVEWLKHDLESHAPATVLIKGSRGMRMERILEAMPDSSIASRA